MKRRRRTHSRRVEPRVCERRDRRTIGGASGERVTQSLAISFLTSLVMSTGFVPFFRSRSEIFFQTLQ